MPSLATSGRCLNLTTTVRVDGETIERLFVKEPRPHDLRPAPAALSDEDVARLIAARICWTPLNVIRALSPLDEERLMDLIEPMLRRAYLEPSYK
jgi:hypothetical protein